MSIRKEDIKEMFDSLGKSSPIRKEYDMAISKVRCTVIVKQKTATTFTHEHKTVTATATQILAANTDRLQFIIQNQDNLHSVWIGGNLVNTVNGYRVGAGKESPAIFTTGAIYAVCKAGEAADIVVVEV